MIPKIGGTRKFYFLFVMLHCISLWLFIHGFLLSRIHLTERSDPFPKSCDTDMPISCSSASRACKRPYSKLIWIVIDALRYDFIVQDGRYPCHQKGENKGLCTHQGHMPKLSKLMQEHPIPTIAFRYIADAPTTTTQRLKAMVSGSLPTFFDISNAFSAPPLDEDNLIDQLVAAGKKVKFVGDATWDNLFPSQFETSLPYPCFNVKDVDTVDDGIWEHFLPTLENYSAWDALIVHYLGVDHAGHSFGAGSNRMAQKLHQMDDQIATVIEKALVGAGEGGPYEDALLLIGGDHGQTLHGDHGGGSPEEVDSVLIAIDMSKLYKDKTKNSIESQPNSFTQILSSFRAPCRSNCTCGEDLNQCCRDLEQIDLVPTLATLLGVPIPFVNLGKMSEELWGIGADRCSIESSETGINKALAYATGNNVQQVHKYLMTYASHPTSRLPFRTVKNLEDRYARLKFVDNEISTMENKDYRLMSRDHLEYLETANSIARMVWTQFGHGAMLGGLLFFIFTLTGHLWYLINDDRVCLNANKMSKTQFILLSLFFGASAVQFFGIFSFFYLLSEGKAVTFVAALMGLFPMFFCASAENRLGIIFISIIAAASAYASSLLGLVNHSGYGFWQRLTVHEPSIQDNNPVVGMTNTGGPQILDQDFLSEDTIFLMKNTLIYFIPALFLWNKISRSLPGKNSARTSLTVILFLILIQEVLNQAIQQEFISDNISLNDMFVYLRGRNILVQRLITFVGEGRSSESFHSVFASFQNLMELPLRILLPRICYTEIARMISLSAFYKTPRMKLVIWLSILLLLMLVSPVMNPLLVCVLGVEFAALSRLIKLAAGSVGFDSIKTAIIMAPMLVTIQSQVFFSTGHLCEFAGLAYTAGFVGFEEFNLLRAGILMSIDTFGAMALVSTAGIQYAVNLEVNPKSISTSTRTLYSDKLKEQKHIVSSWFLFIRAITCFCTMLSAAIQRRHLYAWALFAPRFVFEVSFLLLTDILLLFFS